MRDCGTGLRAPPDYPSSLDCELLRIILPVWIASSSGLWAQARMNESIVLNAGRASPPIHLSPHNRSTLLHSPLVRSFCSASNLGADTDRPSINQQLSLA
eukprot:13059193-Heterocapsa_arctica.AAC.1